MTPSALVLWYSQTGQLRRAAEALVEPLEQAGFNVVWEELRPLAPYPFPWSPRGFLRVFPDAVLGVPAPLEPPAVVADERFDLVVIAYQVWFLAPSGPVAGLFETNLRAHLRGTPVVTLVACRNMWYSAAARMRRLVESAGGDHVGHVAVTDEGPAWATFVSTPRWLLTGRRDRFLRVFPPAGVGEDAIASLARFGRRIVERADELRGARGLFEGLGRVQIEESMAVADLAGALAFRPWAALIAAAEERGPVQRELATAAFALWLVTTVPLAVPLMALARLPFRVAVDRAIRRYVETIAPGGVGAPGGDTLESRRLEADAALV
ncbi:MAG TPA: hypothetical protein VF545_06960 [Thermoleophilaceae bacterium]|jgi:hypothetical protein